MQLHKWRHKHLAYSSTQGSILLSCSLWEDGCLNILLPLKTNENALTFSYLKKKSNFQINHCSHPTLAQSVHFLSYLPHTSTSSPLVNAANSTFAVDMESHFLPPLWLPLSSSQPSHLTLDLTIASSLLSCSTLCSTPCPIFNIFHKAIRVNFLKL